MVDAGIEVANVLVTNGPWLIAVAAAFGFLMAWGIGANDVANAMGTSVGSNQKSPDPSQYLRHLKVKSTRLMAILMQFHRRC